MILDRPAETTFVCTPPSVKRSCDGSKSVLVFSTLVAGSGVYVGEARQGFYIGTCLRCLAVTTDDIQGWYGMAGMFGGNGDVSADVSADSMRPSRAALTSTVSTYPGT